MPEIMTAIGLMSGTSLDGIDAAIVKTDGVRVFEFGPTGQFPYSRHEKIEIRQAIRAALEGRDGAVEVGAATRTITDAHCRAVAQFLRDAGLRADQIDLIGFHGQTILHRPASMGGAGRTWQIGDAQHLAIESGIDVIGDFRSQDVAAGGEGAPFAPIYHAALVARLDGAAREPCAVVNIGGVANITLIPPDQSELDLVAFDCGPGNGLIDEWTEFKCGAPMDKDGALAASGKSDDAIIEQMLSAPFLQRPPPKSLDRYDFKIDPVLKLSAQDGAATLTAFTAECIARAEHFFPCAPSRWIICGGGRHNPALLEQLRMRLGESVCAAEDVGWRGDALEAECFAYLAVRSARALALSFPKTTGVAKPTTGGKLFRAVA